MTSERRRAAEDGEMPKKAITTPKAKAIGPYSAAVESGDLVFVSGQIPLDSADRQAGRG